MKKPDALYLTLICYILMCFFWNFFLIVFYYYQLAWILFLFILPIVVHQITKDKRFLFLIIFTPIFIVLSMMSCVVIKKGMRPKVGTQNNINKNIKDLDYTVDKAR